MRGEDKEPLFSTPPLGDKSFAGQITEGRDLTKAHLAGVDMTDAYLYRESLHNATLERMGRVGGPSSPATPEKSRPRAADSFP
jgi:hypothetical protein